MKKAAVLIMCTVWLTACNNSATVENRSDTAGRQSDTVSQQMWDSGKRDVKELKEKIEGQFDSTQK